MDMSNANPGYPPSSSVNNPAVTNSIDPSKDPNAPPAKRRPGRPKGSTNKKREGESDSVKVKRPVGRPRKDGFPAGSVNVPRPAKQPRLSTGGAPQWASFGGMSYPASASAFATVTTANGQPSGSAGPPQALIDPSLHADAASLAEWAHLSRTDQTAFLSSLLASLAAPNPVSTTGPSVEEAFKSHLVSLATPPSNSSSANAALSQAAQANAIPSLYYVLKTFWLPSSPSYFSLTASASTARTPSEHRFLYWDPLPLVFNGIACPSCAQPLVNKGRISTGPIKIYDIEKPFFIIGCEYVCNSPQCISVSGTGSSTAGSGRHFSSTDSSIFRSLPQRLKDEFPAKLMYESQDVGPGANIWNWSAMGVSRPLWNLIKGCLRIGMRKEAVVSLILGVQQGGGVFGGAGVITGAPLILAAGPVEETLEHQQHSSGVMVEIEEDDMDPDNAEDQLRDDQDDHDGQQGPPDGAAPAPEFIQRFIEAATYNHSASTPNTQPPSSHTVSVTNTPTMRPIAPPHIGPLPHPQAHSQQVPMPVPAQVPTVQVQPHSPQQQTSPFQQQPQLPGPATQVYDYARPFAGYPYAAYAFFPSGHATATTGGSPSLQAAGIGGGDGQPHNPLKRTYPFGEPPSGRGSSATPSMAEPHLLPSSQSPHNTTPSPNIRHQPHPHTQAQPQPQPTPSQIAASSSITSVGGTKYRNPRHCSKCGKADCKGKGGRSFCHNACQDCGKLECRGRNTRKPEKRCEGWGT